MIIMIHNDKVMIMITIYPATGDRNFDQDLDHHLSLALHTRISAASTQQETDDTSVRTHPLIPQATDDTGYLSQPRKTASPCIRSRHLRICSTNLFAALASFSATFCSGDCVDVRFFPIFSRGKARLVTSMALLPSMS